PGIYNDGDTTYYRNYRVGNDIISTNTLIWDTIPACATYVSSNPPGAITGNVICWNLGDLHGGQTGEVSYVVSAATCAGGSTVHNHAAAGSDNAQAVSSNDAPFDVVQPLTKTASPATVSPGSQTTYTMTFNYKGG